MDIAWALHKESLINRARLALGDDARVRAWIAEQNSLFEKTIDITRGFDARKWDAEDLEDIDCFIHDKGMALRNAADADRMKKARSSSEILEYVNITRACIWAIERQLHVGLIALADLSISQEDCRIELLRRFIRRATFDMIDTAVQSIRQDMEENS